MTEIHIRKAIGGDAETITELAIRSKSHWGYSEPQMATFRSELTLTPELMESRSVFVAESERAIVGYYSLCLNEHGNLELEHMFVEPSQMRRGIGTLLFEHARRVAIELGFTQMDIQSDPNARQFYLKLGAALVKEIPSSIPGRTIPFFVADCS
ncbi:MAG: GNAT family N-acetyltransferase [Planctomycetales bacterium]|nr:GNAT family N-acetyltransferase [Planctomycetales bacterium]